MSASWTVSPEATVRDGDPLRPPCAAPPAPRSPVLFSNVTARESIDGSM
jgi:hypothetical protein